MEKFIELLKIDYNHAYDYITNEGYKFSKDELINILRECIWALYCNEETKESFENIANELEEYYLED